MMVKIGNNHTCCFRDPDDFTCKRVTMGKVRDVSLKQHVGFENGIKMTPIFTITFISKMLIQHTSHN